MKANTTMNRTILAAGITVAAALSLAPTAGASPVPGQPNCDRVPWGFLGYQVRAICDGPIQPDGSWERARVTAIPAHYSPATSSCSGGGYSTYCTYYPGGYVDTQILDNETYIVTPETVLPDEPGHLGGGAAPTSRSTV
jgi:hypothetical protein